jgi:hypothetical protein
MKFSERHRRAIAWLVAQRREFFAKESSFTLDDAKRLRAQWDRELSKSGPPKSRGWIWIIGPATAALALLLILPNFFSRRESWDFDPQLQSRGEGPHPLQSLSDLAWRLNPSFSSSNLVIQASNVITWTGTLLPAPELNRFSETNHRYFRFYTIGKDSAGIVVTNSGQLDLQSTQFGEPGRDFKRLHLQAAQITATLSGSNYPPLTVIQVLRPATTR